MGRISDRPVRHVKALRLKVDIVVVSMHGGDPFRTDIEERIVWWVRVKTGADVILGPSSPHPASGGSVRRQRGARFDGQLPMGKADRQTWTFSHRTGGCVQLVEICHSASTSSCPDPFSPRMIQGKKGTRTLFYSMELSVIAFALGRASCSKTAC